MWYFHVTSIVGSNQDTQQWKTMEQARSGKASDHAYALARRMYDQDIIDLELELYTK